MPGFCSLLCQHYWFDILFLHCKSQPTAFMSSIELINLYSMMSAAILSVTSSASVLSKMIGAKAFTEHKNLILETSGLAIGNYVAINNA